MKKTLVDMFIGVKIPPKNKFDPPVPIIKTDPHVASRRAVR